MYTVSMVVSVAMALSALSTQDGNMWSQDVCENNLNEGITFCNVAYPPWEEQNASLGGGMTRGQCITIVLTEFRDCMSRATGVPVGDAPPIWPPD